MKKKYTVLRWIAVIYQFLGIVAPVCAVGLAIITASVMGDTSLIIPAIIGGLISGTFFYAFGGVISVVVDTEENSRRLLSSRRKE